MKMLSSLLILSSISIIANCQNCFEKTYGGIFDEYAHSVQQTDDNGFILCGFTYIPFSGLSKDVYIVKTDVFGNIEWDQTYGGLGEDHGYFISETNDGGYIFCGESTSFGPRMTYLVRINSLGDTLWSNTYPGYYSSLARQVIQTDDNGFIICGSTTNAGMEPSDIFLFKTDADGNIKWSKTYGGPEDEFSYSVCQTQDSGFILCGATKSFGAENYDIYVIKTDVGGDTAWTKTFGGPGYDAAYSVLQTETGEFLIGGHSTNFGAIGWDIIVFKLSLDGDIIWTKAVDYIENEIGCYLSLTSDNCIAGCGYTSGNSVPNSDILIFKMDLDGNIIWINSLGGTSYEVGYAIYETSDFGFIVTGYTQSYGAGLSDMYLVKTNSEGVITTINDQGQLSENIELYPNPAHSIVFISGIDKTIDEINIYNQFGQKVIHDKGTSNKVDVSNLVPGMYVLEVVLEKARLREKLVIK